MKMTNTELQVMRRAATAARAFSAALKDPDPAQSARLNGWTAENLESLSIQLHRLADAVRMADEIYER